MLVFFYLQKYKLLQMRQAQLYLHYHRSLLAFNLPFSLLVSLMSLAIAEQAIPGLINGFSLSLLTGSFILSVYFYEQRHSGQYYFYHNVGISRVKLIVVSYLCNVVLAALLFVLKVYLHA
ncbi:MAG TPA: hypothetical protein VIG72_03265 [Pontibacter sp.]